MSLSKKNLDKLNKFKKKKNLNKESKIINNYTNITNNDNLITNPLNSEDPNKIFYSLIDNSENFIAHNFSGKYLDCGSMQGYIKSTLEISKI